VTDPLASPVTDPTALYAVRDGLYAADMLIAAVSGLDFFTWLDGHPGTVDEIAAHFGFHRRPVDVMTTLFVAMGLIDRDGARLRAAAPAREHLVAHSRWYLGPYYPKVADRPIARDLIAILHSGAPARFASRPDQADWHRAMETEAVAEEFTAAMNCRGLLTAPALAQQVDLSRHLRLLDVAGGSGVFACSFAERYPALRASVLEKPPVDRIAAREIARRGLGDRVDTAVGDMLGQPLPDGYDAHLFSNVLHDWDEDVVRQLLAASATALQPGGLLIVHDTFLNATKTGPLPIAEYSVLLMHVTQGRCYSVAEIESWLDDAGFAFRGIVSSAIGRSAILAERV